MAMDRTRLAVLALVTKATFLNRVLALLRSYISHNLQVACLAWSKGKLLRW